MFVWARLILLVIFFLVVIALGIIAFESLKKKRVYLCVFLVFTLLSGYAFFFCSSPMNAKVNESTMKSGVIQIIDIANTDIDKYSQINFYGDDVNYTTYVQQYKTIEEAEKGFLFYTDDENVDEQGVIDDMKYLITPFYRSRDWRYFGITAYCFGEIYVLYENYVIQIIYDYNKNPLEMFVCLIFPSETLYREEINLSEISNMSCEIDDGSAFE